jgi:hypothetical protein
MGLGRGPLLIFQGVSNRFPLVTRSLLYVTPTSSSDLFPASYHINSVWQPQQEALTWELNADRSRLVRNSTHQQLAVSLSLLEARGRPSFVLLTPNILFVLLDSGD